MKKNHLAAVVYTAAFLAICITPVAAMPFVDTSTSSENRTLAPKPDFHTKEGEWNKAFGMDAEKYLSDHFAFREKMVSTYDGLQAKLTATSAQADVILGKQDWLYYTPTVSDYINEATVSPVGAEHIARSLSMMSAYAAQNGATFLFTVAPNKNEIYPQFMPDRFSPADSPDALTLIVQELQKTKVIYCDLKSALQTAATETDALLYHKWDTHWNNLGATVAFDTLMSTIGLAHTDFSEIPYSITTDWNGDLSTILYPGAGKYDENMEYDHTFQYTYASRFITVDDLDIRTRSEAGTGSLLLFRDSFGRSLMPFLAEAFAEASFQRADHYPLDSLEQNPKDVVVLELVERNLPNLLAYAPQLPAFPCETPAGLPQQPQQLQKAVLKLEKTNGYAHLYGTYDAAFADNTTIYITLTPEQGEPASYMAFPCYEKELLKQSAIQDNGFSLYLPLEQLSGGITTVSVSVLMEDGSLWDLGTAGQFQLGGGADAPES